MRLLAVILVLVIAAAGVLQASAALIDVDAGAVEAVTIPAEVPAPPCHDDEVDEHSADEDDDEDDNDDDGDGDCDDDDDEDDEEDD